MSAILPAPIEKKEKTMISPFASVVPVGSADQVTVLQRRIERLRNDQRNDRNNKNRNHR